MKMSDEENDVTIEQTANDQRNKDVGANEAIDGNWYLVDKPDRLKRIQQHGKAWIDLIQKSIDIKNQCHKAESNYFKMKDSFYNSTNVAVIDGDITKAESVGYLEELKEIDRKIVDLKKLINVNASNANRHRRNSNTHRGANFRNIGRSSNRNECSRRNVNETEGSRRNRNQNSRHAKKRR